MRSQNGRKIHFPNLEDQIEENPGQKLTGQKIIGEKLIGQKLTTIFTDPDKNSPLFSRTRIKAHHFSTTPEPNKRKY